MLFKKFLVVGGVTSWVSTAGFSAQGKSVDLQVLRSESPLAVASETKAVQELKTSKASEISKLIEYLNRKIAKEPNNDKYYAARARCYLDLGEWSKALNSINRAIELNAQQSIYFQLRGSAKLRLRDFAGAELDCAKSESLAPQNSGVRELRALLNSVRLGN